MDTVTALGLLIAVIIVFNIDIDARLAMIALLVMAVADAPIRYWLLSRRES